MYAQGDWFCQACTARGCQPKAKAASPGKQRKPKAPKPQVSKGSAKSVGPKKNGLAKKSAPSSGSKPRPVTGAQPLSCTLDTQVSYFLIKYFPWVLAKPALLLKVFIGGKDYPECTRLSSWIFGIHTHIHTLDMHNIPCTEPGEAGIISCLIPPDEIHHRYCADFLLLWVT